MSGIKGHKKSGQAVAEMAIFGSLIIFLFGTLLAYVQRANDQQYAQMAAFRRALEKSNTHLGNDTDGAGASVQYTLVENRRQSDFSGNFRKGSGQSLSASSNVFWAVPKVQTEPENLIVYRINEDEEVIKYREFIPKEHDSTDEQGNPRQKYWVLEPGQLTTESASVFTEDSTRSEDNTGIINNKSSDLQETIRTTVPFTIKELDKDDKSYEQPVTGRSVPEVDFTQRLYLDEADGQYKYSSSPQIPEDNTVTRTSKWKTDF